MLAGDLTLINLVLDKEIYYLDMFGPFRAARLAIRFEQHCAHVILIDEQRLHCKALLESIQPSELIELVVCLEL